VREARSQETEAERAARYAARDVVDKLGVMPGMAVRTADAADRELRARVRAKAGRPIAWTGPADLILYWPATASEISAALAGLRSAIAPAGVVWVITAKRRAVRPNRPYVPDTALIPAGKAAGLVDNKTCSISERDTAMRFVIPRAAR